MKPGGMLQAARTLGLVRFSAFYGPRWDRLKPHCKGLKIPRPVTVMPVRVRLRAVPHRRALAPTVRGKSRSRSRARFAHVGLHPACRREFHSSSAADARGELRCLASHFNL